MVKELAENFTGKQLRLVKAEHLKFLTIINPRENKLLHVTMAITPGSIQTFQVTAVFFHLETTFFKFKGGFTEE
jgi:3-hydroxyacyl-[acyl-carrier-protein] dehydratase